MGSLSSSNSNRTGEKVRMKHSSISFTLMCAMAASTTSFAAPPDCTFIRGDISKAKATESFFDSPLGAFAIGQVCNRANNTCKYTFPITGCTEVEFPAYQFDDPSISVLVKTSKGCGDDDCSLEGSYIAGTIVHLNNDYSYTNLPTVEMLRNDGWIPVRAKPGYRNRFGPKTISKGDKERIARFFTLQTGNSELQEFESQVVKFFHSKAGEYSSWDTKEIFGEACKSEQNRCTVKAYLFKFTETASGVATKVVRFNSAIEKADGMIFTSRS